MYRFAIYEVHIEPIRSINNNCILCAINMFKITATECNRFNELNMLCNVIFRYHIIVDIVHLSFNHG